MDIDMLKRTAALAKLGIQGREENLLRDFAAMAKYGAGLKGTGDFSADLEECAAVLRADIPGESLSREKVLMNAPEIQEESIAAPRAFD